MSFWKKSKKAAPVPEAPPLPPSPPMLKMEPVRRFVMTDKDGSVIGFYSTDINPVIPMEAQLLTEEQYRMWHEGHCADQKIVYKLVSGKLTVKE